MNVIKSPGQSCDSFQFDQVPRRASISPCDVAQAIKISDAPAKQVPPLVE